MFTVLVTLACIAVAVVLLGLALFFGSDRYSIVGGVLLMFGMVGVLVGGVGAQLAAYADDYNESVAALEERYDITIDDANMSEEPSPWRIDGDWRTCYVPDLNAETIELLCAIDNPEYVHP